MRQFLPILLVMICPLMMLFMMRGVGRNDRGGVPPDPGSAMPTADEEQARIAQLKHQVAELRAARDRDPGEAVVQRG